MVIAVPPVGNRQGKPVDRKDRRLVDKKGEVVVVVAAAGA